MKMNIWKLCPQGAVREEGVREVWTLTVKKGEINLLRLLVQSIDKFVIKMYAFAHVEMRGQRFE